MYTNFIIILIDILYKFKFILLIQIDFIKLIFLILICLFKFILLIQIDFMKLILLRPLELLGDIIDYF
jgi:hypothetical protein